jgi:uncharacterized repeat protein (TIGR02543 family)
VQFIQVVGESLGKDFGRRRLRRVIVAAILAISPVFVSASESGAINAYHNVTFMENDNSSDTTSLYQQANVSTSLTLFASLSPSFANSGYTFTDWNTSADGTGTIYTDGEVYSFAADLVLYAQWVENRVTFCENASTSDSVTATELGTTSSALTAFAAVSPAFVKPGYTFTGWNTHSDGSGVAYADGSTYNFTAGSTSLYAQWMPSSYTVTYDANGGSVSPTSATYSTGAAPLTLPTPTESGHSFVGWFSAATGGTLVGSAGSSYTPTGSVTLYAQWTADSYLITYAGDGATIAPSSASYTTGSSPLTLPSPLNAGYVFAGWFSAASGGTLIGLGGASYTPTASVTLFAQWTPGTYTVNFVVDGGILATTSLSYTTGTTPIILPAPSLAGSDFTGWFSAPSGGTLLGIAGMALTPSSPVTLYAQWRTQPTFTITFVSNGAATSLVPLQGLVGSAVTIPATATLSLANYTFAGWNTNADGSGDSYTVGQSLAPTNSLTLYAQWHAVPTVVISFNLNGASGSMTPLSGPTNSKVSLPGASGLSRPGYRFVGWAVSASGTSPHYASGQLITLNQSVVLYAQWRPAAAQYLMSSVGPFASHAAVLTSADEAQVKGLVAHIASGHFHRVTVYGYVSSGSPSSYARSMSLARAQAVAAALRAALHARGLGAIGVVALGEGAMPGHSGASARRVEIFVS